MRSCPVPNRYWRRLVNKLGNEDIAYNLYFSKGDSVYDMSDEELSKYTTTPKVETQYQIPAESTEGKIVSEKTIRDLAARMADRIGLNYKIISDRTQVFKGKLEGNTAVVNLAYATLDTPIHEILGHPIIRAIKASQKVDKDAFDVLHSRDVMDYEGEEGYVVINYSNHIPFDTFYKTYEEAKNAIPIISEKLSGTSQLYQNLLKELEYGRGKEILDRVKRDYGFKKRTNLQVLINSDNQYYDLYDGDKYIGSYLTKEEAEKIKDYEINKSKYSLEEQQEEALVELLGLMTADRLDAVSDGKLISLLKRLLKEIKAFVKELLGQREIEIDELPDNITLGDIADILAYSNSKLILPGNEVIYTTPDNQEFLTYAEASRHISNLAKNVTDIDLNDIDQNIAKLPPKPKREDFNVPEGTMFNGKEVIDIQYDQGEAPEYMPDENVMMPGVPESYIIRYKDGSYEQIYQDEIRMYNNAGEDTSVLFNYGDEAYKMALRRYQSEINKNIQGFIIKNREYERSKEIIDEWKRVNNIVYNPEEVYSRGQEFVSVVGAYSNFDVKLMMQNLLQHIEDNEKAGGEFTISAFTKPIDKTIGHLEGGGGKIKFKIYPKPEDIKWAADSDVYSGSVWDASEKVNKDKKSELLGVSYTKYPGLIHVNSVKPNLASIIDNIRWHHNELGITLTGGNFRLEYDDNIPYSTKKIIDSVNSILDQKYGKLVKPKIDIKSRQGFKVFFTDSDGNSAFANPNFNTMEEAQAFIDEKQDSNTSFKIVPNLGIQPTQTNETLIQSIDDIRDKYSSSTRLTENSITDIGEVPLEFESETTDGSFAIVKFEDNTWKAIRENGDMKNLSDWQVLRAYNKSIGKTYNKEFTSQAIINTKIAKLKEVAKKYPRSLIRSEVKRQMDNADYNGVGDDLFEEDELPFQKVPSMQPGSYSRYRPSSTISILKQVKFRESIKPGDVTSFTYWSETTSKLVSEKDIVVESVGNDYFEGRYPNGEGRTFKYKNIVDDSIQGTLTTFEQKQFKDKLMLGQTIFVKTNIGDFNGKVTSIEEDSFSVDNQQINYSDVFKEEPQLAFLQNIQDLKETISNQIVVYQSKMKTVDQKKRVESLRRALEMLEGYKEYNDLIGFFAEVRSNIDDTKALLKAVVDPEKKYTPEKILYIISYAKDFLDSYFHLRGLNNSIQNFEGSEELKAISNQLFADLENTKQEYFNVALPQLRDVLWEQFDMNTNNQLAAAGEKIYTKERLLEELKNPTRDLDYFNKFFVAPINSNDIILGLFSKMLKKGKEAARKINEFLIRDLTPMVNSLKKKYDLKELMKNFYTITEETIFEDGKPRIIRVRRFIQKYNQKKYYDETNLMYQERQRAIDDINLAEAAGDATARENALGRYKIINEKLNAYKRLNGVQITASQFKTKMEKLKALNDDDFIKNLDRYYTPTTEAESDENSIVTENELTGEKTYYRYTNKRWEANKEMFITDEYKRLQTLFDRDPEVKRFFDYLMDKYEEANRKIPEAYRLRGVVPSVYETNFLNSIKKGWKNFWKTNEKQLMVRLDGKPYKEIPIGFTKLIDIDESSDDILRSTMLFLAEANNFGEMSRYLGTADALVEALEAKYPLDSSQKQKMFSSMNNRLDAVKRTIDQTLYGIHKDSYGLGSKVLDLLNKFTSFTRIALKPLNWISNILVGNMGNLSEAVGGRHFGVRDIMWAQKEMFKLMFTNPKKFANMIRSLDAVQGRFLKEFGDEFISFREKYVAWDTMFIGQDMGELQIQGTAMLAYLRARKIPIPADGNFDLDSLPPDFINTLHAINKHNHGVYNNFDRLYLQTNALFRLMLQFRKYIVPTFRARYDGLFSGNNRVDWESGTVEKGWWRIWGEYHYNTIKNWKQMPSFIASFNSLTDAEKEGVRRAYFDAAAYTLLYGLFVMMKPDDDEEEETSKFEWHVLYQLEKLKGDYGLIFPLGGFEDKLRLLSNPFAAAPVVADSLAILSQVTNFEPDKEGNVSIYQRYQRDTGYYKKGDLKILGKVSKINGFDNFIQSEDPETALQAYLAAARR